MTYGMYCSVFITVLSIICIIAMKKILPEAWKLYVAWVVLVEVITIWIIANYEGWGLLFQVL